MVSKKNIVQLAKSMLWNQSIFFVFLDFLGNILREGNKNK